MSSWQMQEAKARLSELLRCAATEGPQDITPLGRTVAVVMWSETYQRLSGQRRSLVDFMQASPLAGLDEAPVFERDVSHTRDVGL